MTVVDRAVDVIAAAAEKARSERRRGTFRDAAEALAAAGLLVSDTIPAEDRAGTSVAEDGTHNASDAGSIPAPPTVDASIDVYVCRHCGEPILQALTGGWSHRHGFNRCQRNVPCYGYDAMPGTGTRCSCSMCERWGEPSDYCGCCGRPTTVEALWCADCLPHVADPGPPLWERTYYAQHDLPCPWQVRR